MKLRIFLDEQCQVQVVSAFKKENEISNAALVRSFTFHPMKLL